MITRPTNLCTAVAAGSSLAKTLWPGSLTVTLPAPGEIAYIYSGSNVVGGVFASHPSIFSLLVDYAGVGAADRSPTFEMGELQVDGSLARPLHLVTIKGVTTSGTVANINPFTAAAVSATTFRLFDLDTITNYTDQERAIINLGGTEDNQPSQLIVDVTEANYYYFLCTGLDTMTSLLLVATPQLAPRQPGTVDGGGSPNPPADVNVAQVGGVNTSTGAGAVTSGTLRTTLASDDPAVAALGAVADAAVAQGAAGSISAKLRTATGQLNTLAGYLDGVEGLLAGGLPATLSSDGGLKTTLVTKIPAGDQLIGKVGIDQTTPGATNAVSPIAGVSGVAAGAGAVGTTTQRTTLASDDPAVATLGATTGAAVVTDANGTIQQYLRGLVKLFIGGVASLINVVGNVAGAATDSGNPIKVGGKYNTTQPTYTDGQRTDLQTDSRGNIMAYQATQLDYTNDVVGVADASGNRQRSADAMARALYTQSGFSFLNIVANGTNVVKSGAGILHSITFNTPGASANTITVYDNTAGSGTKIATIGGVPTTSGLTLRYDAAFGTGLTVVTATGTCADITVTYI